MTRFQCFLKLIKVVLGKGASDKDGVHAGLDGDLVGASCFGITDQGDELSRQGVHRQADEALLADGCVDGGDHQRIPEGEVVGTRGGWSRGRLRRVACCQPVQILSPSGCIPRYAHESIVINATNDALVLTQELVVHSSALHAR